MEGNFQKPFRFLGLEVVGPVFPASHRGAVNDMKAPSLILVAASLALSLAVGCGQSPEVAPAQVAFLVFDAGETLALMPVADRLEESLPPSFRLVPETPLPLSSLRGR